MFSKTKERIKRNFSFLLLLIVVGVIIFPYIWMIISSLKPLKEMFSVPPSILPKQLTLNNYINLFKKTEAQGYSIFRIFINSLGIGLISAVLSAFIGAFAAYGLSRLKIKGGSFILMGILIVQLLPPTSIIIPLFLMASYLKILDTWVVLIIIYSSYRIAFATWVMSGFFQNIPTELEDAALIDGCTIFEAFRKVILPIAKPAMATVIILGFMFCWNEFMFALIMTFTSAAKTLPILAAETMTSESMLWGKLNAIGTVIAIPSLIFTFMGQKYIARGLTAGAIK